MHLVLFETPFYRRCAERLRPGGLFAAQVGFPMYDQDEMHMAHRNASAAFGAVRVYLGAVPTYPGVSWAFMLAGASLDIDARSAEARAAERTLVTRYWTPEVHAGAFALPALVRDALGPGAPPNPFKP